MKKLNYKYFIVENEVRGTSEVSTHNTIVFGILAA